MSLLSRDVLVKRGGIASSTLPLMFHTWYIGGGTPALIHHPPRFSAFFSRFLTCIPYSVAKESFLNQEHL